MGVSMVCACCLFLSDSTVLEVASKRQPRGNRPFLWCSTLSSCFPQYLSQVNVETQADAEGDASGLRFFGFHFDVARLLFHSHQAGVTEKAKVTLGMQSENLQTSREINVQCGLVNGSPLSPTMGVCRIVS